MSIFVVEVARAGIRGEELKPREVRRPAQFHREPELKPRPTDSLGQCSSHHRVCPMLVTKGNGAGGRGVGAFID